MREVIGDRTVDELITIGRQDIEIEALALMQDLSKRYHLGIRGKREILGWPPRPVDHQRWLIVLSRRV